MTQKPTTEKINEKINEIKRILKETKPHTLGRRAEILRMVSDKINDPIGASILYGDIETVLNYFEDNN